MDTNFLRKDWEMRRLIIMNKKTLSVLILIMALITLENAFSALSLRIYITSDPNGAWVYIDNAKIGMTPLAYNVIFRKNPQGDFETKNITIKKECYLPKTVLLNITDPPDINFILEKDTTSSNCWKESTATSSIMINSVPQGAEIYIDQKMVGVTPMQVDLTFSKNAQGNWDNRLVQVQKWCYKPSYQYISSSKNANINFTLIGESENPQCQEELKSTGSLSASSASQAVDLSAKYESIKLPPKTGDKPYVAVMDMKGVGGEEQVKTAAVLTDLLRTELSNTGYFKLCDRANMDQVMKEIGLQQSGCTSSECVVQIGRVLGVSKMVTGSISKLGKSYIITLQIVDIETALIVKSVSERAECKEEELYYLVGIAAKKLCIEQP